jgi:hypothetical protein
MYFLYNLLKCIVVISILFFLITQIKNLYFNSYFYCQNRKHKNKQKELNSYNRSSNEEFDIYY